MTTPASYADHLAAIVAAPEHDGPRMALSAWLEPHQPALAMFIRLQIDRVAAMRRAGERDTEILSGPEQRLLVDHGTTWMRGFASYTDDSADATTFHRGLVARVTMDPEVFLERGDYLLGAWPIRHVDFGPMAPGVLDRLLASEPIARLDSIGLLDPALGDDDVRCIAASPALARCAYLRLACARLGPPAFDALAGSAALRALLVVDCPSPAFPGEAIEVQRVASGTTARLREMSAAGKALEAEHGYLPWLHRDRWASRYDARWYRDRDALPTPRMGAS